MLVHVYTHHTYSIHMYSAVFSFQTHWYQINQYLMQNKNMKKKFLDLKDINYHSFIVTLCHSQDKYINAFTACTTHDDDIILLFGGNSGKHSITFPLQTLKVYFVEFPFFVSALLLFYSVWAVPRLDINTNSLL